MLTKWLLEEYMGSTATGLGNPNIDGFFLDDLWRKNGPSESGENAVEDMGLSATDLLEIESAWRINMNAAKEMILKSNGFNWQLFDVGTVRVLRQKFTLKGAIGSHACSLEASRCVTNGIPLGCPLFLLVRTVNCVQTLKAIRQRRVLHSKKKTARRTCAKPRASLIRPCSGRACAVRVFGPDVALSRSVVEFHAFV
jgi:hypothetical protein